VLYDPVADYRVPQVLRSYGILVYSPETAQLVDSRQPIACNSEMEIEIRAATVQAVERLHARLSGPLMVVELDWLLWQMGEATLGEMQPHHRTLSIYY
jgi:hypothetical protein